MPLESTHEGIILGIQDFRTAIKKNMKQPVVKTNTREYHF